MSPRTCDPGLRPFNESGYEILDEGLASRGELVIWSVDPLPPRVGDLYTVESGGAIHEVQVADVTLFDAGWSAQCKACGGLE